MKKLYTIILVALIPLSAQYNDSTYSQCLEMNKKKAEIKSKEKKFQKFVLISGVAIVSYYVGYNEGKNQRRHHLLKGRFRDKDYGGQP